MPLLPERISGEECEERRVELVWAVEHGHVRRPIQDEQARIRDLRAQDGTDRRGHQGVVLAPDQQRRGFDPLQISPHVFGEQVSGRPPEGDGSRPQGVVKEDGQEVRLKKLVAEQALDIDILKEVNRGNF